jgi:hypothetical protein
LAELQLSAELRWDSNAPETVSLTGFKRKQTEGMMQLHVREFAAEGWDGTAEGVGNYENEESLREIFSQFGPFVQAMIRHRIRDGQNKSWALVAMGTVQAVEAALAAPVIMAGSQQVKLTRYRAEKAAKSKGGMRNIMLKARDGIKSSIEAADAEAIAAQPLRTVDLEGGFSFAAGMFVMSAHERGPFLAVATGVGSTRVTLHSSVSSGVVFTAIENSVTGNILHSMVMSADDSRMCCAEGLADDCHLVMYRTEQLPWQEFWVVEKRHTIIDVAFVREGDFVACLVHGAHAVDMHAAGNGQLVTQLPFGTANDYNWAAHRCENGFSSVYKMPILSRQARDSNMKIEQRETVFACSSWSLRCSEELLVVSGGVGTVDKDTIGIWTLNHLKDYLDADLSTSPSESKQQMCGPEPSQRLNCELPTAVGSSDNTTVHWAGLCCAICVFLERG